MLEAPAQEQKQQVAAVLEQGRGQEQKLVPVLESVEVLVLVAFVPAAFLADVGKGQPGWKIQLPPHHEVSYWELIPHRRMLQLEQHERLPNEID